MHANGYVAITAAVALIGTHNSFACHAVNFSDIAKRVTIKDWFGSSFGVNQLN